LKATFPEELPLCCAVLISAAIYTRPELGSSKLLK